MKLEKVDMEEMSASEMKRQMGGIAPLVAIGGFYTAFIAFCGTIGVAVNHKERLVPSDENYKVVRKYS